MELVRDSLIELDNLELRIYKLEEKSYEDIQKILINQEIYDKMNLQQRRALTPSQSASIACSAERSVATTIIRIRRVRRPAKSVRIVAAEARMVVMSSPVNFSVMR